MNKKNGIFYALFLIFLGLMSNCQKPSINKGSKMQVLRINFSVDICSFHPHLVTDVRTHTVCKALFEGLTRVNPQGNIEFAAAKKVEISPSKTKYIFTLRPSKWSNGERVKSHHFIDAWKEAICSKSKCFYVERLFLIKNAKQVYNKNLSADELGIYAYSDNQIVIELEHPAPYFLQLVADPIYSPIYNPKSNDEQTIFNGPFVIEKYSPSKQLDLAANPLYWDAETVKLKNIQINFIKNMQSALFMFEENKLDWIGSPFSGLSDETIQNFSNIKTMQASAPFWIFCNTQIDKLKSAKIRKALAYSINREEIIKHVIPNQKEALHNILSKDISSIASEDSLKNNNIEKAQELFENGLKEVGINKKDFQITLNHSTATDQQKIAVYLKHLWEKIFKISVILKKDDWNSFYSKIISGNYEIGGCFICNIYDDPSYFMGTFEHSHSNFSKWENKDYQKYFTLAKQSLDEKQRKDYLKKAEEILMEEMPVIPIYNHAHLYLCKDGLENFSAPKFNYADFKYAYYTD